MAKRGSSALKLGILFGLFALGGLVGAVADRAFPTVTVMAQAPNGGCEEDECDDGWFGGSCEANVGQRTGCDKVDTAFWFDGCTTYSCGN